MAVKTQQNLAVQFKAASDIERKAIGDSLPEGYIAGWASTPTIDSYGHSVDPNAFNESIAEKGLIGPRSIKFLLNHNWDEVAGIILVLEVRNNALWIEAQLNLKISYVRDFYEAAKMNEGMNFSIGFMLEDYGFKKTPEGEEFLFVTRGELIEISAVPIPANEECVMTFIKAKDAGTSPSTIAEFEKKLVSLGLANSRNNARRIAQEVKASIALFSGKAVAPEAAPTNTAPVMAKEEIVRLSERISALKAAFAPVART